MTIQECKQLLLNKEYLTQTIVPLYQQEDNKLQFARLQLLHLFFESGIQKNYNVLYLDTLCTRLGEVFEHIFSYNFAQADDQVNELVVALLHYALLPDLEDLQANLQFYEIVFSTLEEYEVCANLTFLNKQVIAEIARKSETTL